MKNNKTPHERFSEAIQRAVKEIYGKEITLEKIAYFSKFTEQLVERAQEGFVCSKCKDKYKVIILNKNDYENPRT